MTFSKTSLRTFSLCALPALALMVGGCEVDVEDEGALPSVDVEGDSGQMPKYEVNQTQEGRMPSIDDVDADSGRLPEVDVRGPDVEIGTEQKEVTVPDIDVTMPDDRDDATNN